MRTAGIIEEIAGDLLGMAGLPLAGTTAAVGASAWSKLLEKRIDRARRILQEEIARGTKSLSDVPDEELASVAFRYLRAATEGTARLNLRLMAATASGQANGAGLYADEFLRWADLIANLRREEVIVLATLYREWNAFKGGGVNRLDAWPVAQDTLSREAGMDKKASNAIGTACLRTGLVQIATGLSDGGHRLYPTSRLHTFMVLADVEGVLLRSEI